MTKIRVRLLGAEHSVGRGVGFYRTHLAEAFVSSGQVELVESGEVLTHYPFFDLFYPTLQEHITPTIVTIHDVIPLIFPNLYPLGIRSRLALRRQKKALANVCSIVTDSLSAKADIVKHLAVPAEKVFVTHLAINPLYQKPPLPSLLSRVRVKYALPERFILYVGGINPNKNLLRLARTAVKLNTSLVLVGGEFASPLLQTFSLKRLLGLQPVHPEVQEFIRLKELAANNPLLLFLGFVPDEDLSAIYRLATLYCQPSLYEGFGLSLLEAMTASCLVVTSTGGSLPEIYPPGSFVFDPTNQPEMERVIATALGLPHQKRSELVKLALEKAQQFNWKKTALATIDVYQSCLRSQPSRGAFDTIT